MGFKTVTNTCELEILCPRKEAGVRFRPIHTKADILKLKDVAHPLGNTSTVDNRRPGKRSNIGCTGLSQENIIMNRQQTSEKTSGQHMFNA